MIQEDDDNRRYEAELSRLAKEKEDIISQLSAEFDALRVEKQEL